MENQQALLFQLKKASRQDGMKSKPKTRIQIARTHDENNLRLAREVLAGKPQQFRCTEIWARLVIFRLGTHEEKAALADQTKTNERGE